jgi:peptidoglycan hydrolase CwlO-like protein
LKSQLLLGTLLVSSVFALSACTKYASDKELQQLDAKNSQIQKLQSQLSNCNSGNATIQSQIASAKSKLSKLQSDEQFVKEKLKTFNAGADQSATSGK